MNLVNQAIYSQVDYAVEQIGNYLVVPVVMMTEGVRSGSGGPILHLEEHYSQNPEVWNGVPVTAGHPQNNNGNYVSVNEVSQDQWVVGHLKDARVEDGKLKANVWINEQRAIAVNPEVVNYISEGKKLEVSIGAFTKDKNQSGEYDGEQYEAITVMYSPDHLALLPGSRGACSWSDGCGIRNNEDDMNDNHIQSLKEAIKEGRYVINHLQNNEAGFLEIANEVQTQLDRLDSEARMHFLKEVYKDSIIYKVRDKDRGTERYYRQEYSTDEAGGVVFEGQPTEVRKNVEFVPIQDNENCGCDGEQEIKSNNTNKEAIMSDEKSKTPSGAVMKQVVGLINNEQTHFTDSDQSWLLNLNEHQLSKLEPKEMPEPEITQEQAVQVLSDEGVLGDIEVLKGILPEDTKEKVETGLSAYTEMRQKLSESIQNNSEEWEDEDLEAMDLKTLQKIEKSVRPVDYSGKGPVNNISTNNSKGGGSKAPLYPAGVNIE